MNGWEHIRQQTACAATATATFYKNNVKNAS
jgi:hypothetical protein